MKKELPKSTKKLSPFKIPASSSYHVYAREGRILAARDRVPDYIPVRYVEGEKINQYTRLYGIELEVEQRANTPTDIVKRVYQALDQCAIVKHDGSLQNGFEIVSAPATLEAHRVMWQPFFEGPSKFLKSFDTTTCGMHIHISRASIPPTILYRFWKFMNQYGHDNYIARIAGRSANQYSRTVSNRSFFDEVINPADRYSFVNLRNEATIEVRIFRGNTDRIGFFKNLDFCDSLLVLLEQQPQATGREYINFILNKNNRVKWPYMFEWMKRHKVELEEVIPKELPKPIKSKRITLDENMFKFPGE